MIMFDAPVPTSTANSVAQWQAEVEVEHDAPFFWMLRMQHRKDILHLSIKLVKYTCESAFVILFKNIIIATICDSYKHSKL